MKVDSGPVIKDVKPGMKIKIREHKHGEDEDREVTYTVTKVYPYMVLAERDKDKMKRSFSYGDLAMMRLESQSDELEAMKMPGYCATGARYLD